MKKLSMSLVAVLAIAFAVSSAFTTAKSTVVKNGYYLYSDRESDPVLQNDEENIDPILFDDPTVDPESEGCEGGDYVCAAFFNNSDEPSSFVYFEIEP